MTIREFIRSTWKVFVALAVGLGFFVDFRSVRSNIGDIFPAIAAFLPFIGLVTAAFAAVWIIKTAWLYYLANRPAARFRRLSTTIVYWRGCFNSYHRDFNSYGGVVDRSTGIQLRDSLLEIKYEFDRLGIRYPAMDGKGPEWAGRWIDFLSLIAMFSEKADLSQARKYSCNL